MSLNVTNEYTYTLETIIQAGRNRIPMMSVPIRTNRELRPSRLFRSMFGYIKRSASTIVRSYVMYKPMAFFTLLGTFPFTVGFALGLRFLYFMYQGNASGHVQSLILASTLLMLGFMVWVTGIQADTIAASRKILEDVQNHVRRLDYDNAAARLLARRGDSSMVDNRAEKGFEAAEK